jgi:cytoskeletal protein CcmA (bactofilin family)
VHATETLELQAGSKVKGDVHYKSIESILAPWLKGGWCIIPPR